MSKASVVCSVCRTEEIYIDNQDPEEFTYACEVAGEVRRGHAACGYSGLPGRTGLWRVTITNLEE